MTPPPTRYGAIDVGSNSIRLLVADYTPEGGLAVIDELKDQPRLAKGLAHSGRLDQRAMDRAVEAIGRMRDVAQRRGVTDLRAVATAAVREASNGEAFVARIRQLGVPLTIIDADTEARLSYRSIAYHFTLDDSRTIVLDIGGGSLEIVGAVRGFVELSQSLPLGAVRLSELYLPSTRSVHRELPRLRRRIRKALKQHIDCRSWTGAQVFGSGGSFTNLGRIAAARRGRPTSAVHGLTVTTAEVEHLLEWLASMEPAERRRVAGLNPARSDIIIAGLVVTAEMLARIESPSLTVSAFGLREGLLLEAAGVSATPTEDPAALARDFAHRCQCDHRHIEQVRLLALQLFDRLARPLGADPSERDLLEQAALLHDVGQLISYRKRHRHSFELIMHAERLGLSTDDRTMVAFIARYHRKKGPSMRDDDFARLPRPERRIVRRMSALLRIADGLDRGYSGVVTTIRTRLTDHRLRITPIGKTPDVDLSLECWGAQRRTGALSRLLDRPVAVIPRQPSTR